MPKIIHSITVKDFRSFDNKTINFQDVTCLIGANESGKTNLLDSINLMKAGDKDNKEDKRVMRPSDTRKNSPQFNNEQLPIIKYELDISLLGEYFSKKIFSDKRTLTLIRDGNDFMVEIPKIEEGLNYIENLSDEIIELSVTKGSNEDKKITSRKENKVVKVSPKRYIIISDADFEKYKQSLKQAIDGGQARILEGDECVSEIEKILLSKLENSLKIFFWSYEKKYYLPDLISFEDIKTKLNQLPVIEAIFKLGGYEASQIPGVLEGKTETDFDNIFYKISEKISNEIQSKWRTNKKIEILIRHKKDHLSINIKEPGYFIEPQYRSEGLKWFLAFIIGMIAGGESLKNNIILIDEPALHLHPGGQKDVLLEINRLAKDNQIIYSTHSHFMIDRRYRDRVLFLFKDLDKEYSLTDIKKPSEQDLFRDPLLRTALIYSISDLSFINENNILVEGSFDKHIIDLISNWLIKKEYESTINLNNTSVISCNGASEIKKHAELYKGSNLICLSLYDSDKPGLNAYESNKGQKDKEKIGIKEIYDTGETMEDLLHVEVFKEALGKWQDENSIIDDKLIPNIKPPRMKKVIQTMDSHLNKNGKSTNEISEERLRLKHDLEDKIIFETTKLLEKIEPDNDKVKNLMALNTKLVEKLNSLKNIK